MKVEKMNPESEIIQQMEGQWQKLLMVIAWKAGREGITIGDNDIIGCIAAFEAEGGPVLLTHGHKDSIQLRVVSRKEAEEIVILSRIPAQGNS